MSKKILFLSILFLLFTSWLPAAPLKVLSASPKGLLNNRNRQAVSITFNQPVTSLSETSQLDSSHCPITLSPEVTGVCRYSGTQTLLFEPRENWPEATRFTVMLKKGFRSQVSNERLEHPYTFTFSTPVPKVQQVLPRNEEHWIGLNPTFYVVFSMPVDLEQLPQYVSLTYPNMKKPIPLITRKVSSLEREKNFPYYEQNNIIAVSPLETLRKDTRYTLTLAAGLKAASGPLGMTQDYQTHFYTYPNLTVQGQVSSGCLPYMPALRFSGPVRLRELVRKAQISPKSAMRQLSEQELDALGQEFVFSPNAKLSSENTKFYREKYNLSENEIQNGAAFFFTPLSFLKLSPKQSVQITLPDTLQDIYGNRLGKSYSFTVTNEGYCPAVEFSGGLGVLESYQKPRLPIDVMNTPSLPVQAARFNKDNFLPFYTQAKPYCSRVPLTSPTFDGQYTFRDVKDKTLKTYFDLTKFQPTSQDSIIFSQVKLSGKNYPKEGCWVSSTDNITDVGITFKTSGQNILLWATSLQTGEPLPALSVELRGKNNEVLWTGSTDMNGLAWAPGWKKIDGLEVPSWDQPPLYAFVSSPDGDAVVSNLWTQGLEPWRFNLNYEYNPQRESIRSFLFSDRGVYRPGETFYLTGITRDLKEGGWSVPAEITRGTVVISNARGEEVLNREVTLSENGTFSLSYPIPASAFTGMWDVSFKPVSKGDVPTQPAYYSFQVLAVKQADFAVTLLPEKEAYTGGEEAKFLATAHYHFGSPLNGAKASWTLRREMAWFEPKGFSNYTFVPFFLRDKEAPYNGKLIVNSSGTTNAQGALQFNAKLPMVSTPTRVYAEVGVQSPSRQDLFARSSVWIHPASFYLGSRVETKAAEAGKPVTAQVVAVTPEGKPVEATVTASIRKEQWYSVRKAGLAGRLEWISEKKEIELPSQQIAVGKKGVSFSFLPEEAGNYFVTLSSKDEAGRAVTGGFNVMVYGKGKVYWPQQEDDLLVLKQDKNSYKPGKVARISLQSPYEKARALVTVEREGILDAWVTEIQGGADYVEVPIKEAYLPNVYVGVSLVRGRTAEPVSKEGIDLGKPQGKTGYVNLRVEPDSKRIDVAVQPEKEQYLPGKQVTVDLSTRVGGKGIPSEVTVMVVDEGVLALTDFKTPDLFSYFYGSRPISVFTATNRSYIIGQRNFGEKGENRGGGGSVSAKLGGQDLRSAFTFTPYFQSAVKTDKKGRAQVTFTLPDNLTKFRIMAVASSAAEFGSGEASVKVSKPVMVTSNLPRFARKGDSFQCGAVVYNYEDKNGQLTVTAHATGALQLSGPLSKTMAVPLGEAKAVSWPCQAMENGSATVSFRVEGKKHSDGVLARIEVSAVEKEQTLSLYGTTQNTQEELLEKPENLNTQAPNRITFSLASTALLNLKGSMLYLMTYPYDCLEQQMSKILPVIKGADLITDFGLGAMNALKKDVQLVLDKIPQYQASSGGFSYWKNGLPDPYVTAYVLEVNKQAEQAGYAVQTASLKKAADWLEKAFQKTQTRAYTYSVYETETSQAYAAYVLGLYGRKVSSTFNTLYAKRNSLPFPALAYLLKIAHVLDQPANVKSQLAQGMLNHIQHTPNSVYFTAGAAMPWLHMSDVSSTALAVEALLFAGEPFEEGFKAVSWLLAQLTANGHWNNTYENALVFSALQTYYRTYEKTVPNFQATVKLGLQTVLTATFRGRNLKTEETQIPFAQAYDGQNAVRIRLNKTGSGTLYYTLGQVYEPAAYSTSVSAGFDVSRQITSLDGTPVAHFKAGERYRVTLTVKTAASRHFVVLEDFIPAGFELIHTSLATESSLQAQSLQSNRGFHHSEKYDDRIAAFADYLPAGTYTYSYLVTALVPGRFAYPCAWASQMYEPAVFGRNHTAYLTIDPL